MSNWTFVSAEKSYPAGIIRLLFKPEEPKGGDVISLTLHVENAAKMVAEISKLLAEK